MPVPWNLWVISRVITLLLTGEKTPVTHLQGHMNRGYDSIYNDRTGCILWEHHHHNNLNLEGFFSDHPQQ